MEPGLNSLHAISLFGRFSFALLLIIRPDHFGKRTCLYSGVGLFLLLGALLRLARHLAICCRADVSFAAYPKGDHMEMGISRRQHRIYTKGFWVL